MTEHEALAVRLGHMSKWFTDQSYEATTLREAQAALAATPAVGGEALDHAADIVRLIEVLRSDEGDSITILCDNPDFNGQPNCAIVCNGDWTGWVDKRFAADTVLDALSMAMVEKNLPSPRKVIATSNGHHWIERFNLVCCRDCGLVRRADDQNSPCKGPVGVGIRQDLAAQPASPLRGREDLAPSPCSDLSIGELIEWLDNPQWTNGYLNSDAANHMSAAAELIERLVSSAPPEQPAAVPAVCARCQGSGLFQSGNQCYRCYGTGIDPAVVAQPAAAPVTGLETIREIVHANAKTTLIGFNEISDKNAEFICDQISRKVELALLSAAPDKQPLRYGEPVWPGNENDDEGDKA